MRFVYPAQLHKWSEDEVVVSFRDVPWCHTSGADEAEALLEAEDALEEAVAGCINHGEPIPEPSAPLPGEHLVPLPVTTAAKAALATAFRASGMTQAALAERLGVDNNVVHRMLNPRHRTIPSRMSDALRVFGGQTILEVTLPDCPPEESAVAGAEAALQEPDPSSAQRTIFFEVPRRQGVDKRPPRDNPYPHAQPRRHPRPRRPR